ncbi:hypothetical protein GCM10010284_67260 [Streptomyces rubiginosohelvolus]|uniref:hypothetical protein n=1 Tax=Streptomyces rubiginosohelvolus TaxID=67362 RepID=UPI0016731915|nr:hypothetical protein [Streptomyces rubiginosohelvolus]GGS24859.1 hypothetical protein GCM10010284_67260 [Streptomyces rubiginosohelvolus]
MARNQLPRRTDEAQIRLTPQDLEKLRAVVFDANAYGHARPDFDQLGRWAKRLAGMEIETWVPEPVAWEWAEHLARDWEFVNSQTRNQRKQLQSAGLEVPAPSGYASRDDVIAAVLANLSAIPHVKVIALTGLSAVEGLKDQILQRPPAKTKGGSDPTTSTKTGASDGAWLRDVLQLAEPDEILIVTSDKDVPAAFKAWGIPAPHVRPLKELRPTLFDLAVDDGHARSAIIRYLTARLPADQQNQDVLDIGRVVGLQTAYSRMWESQDYGLAASDVSGASVTGLVALAGIGLVRVEAGGSTDQQVHGRRDDPGTSRRETADAVVYFLATGEATVSIGSLVDDHDVTMVPINNVLVCANLTFQFADGVITAMSADTDSAAMLVERAFNQSEEAETELVQALSLVPGITLEEGELAERQRFDIPGTDNFVVITVGGNHGMDWGTEIDLWLGDDEEEGEPVGTISLECEYDPSSWYGGGRDGFQGPDSYPVAVDGDGLHGRYGIWALPAWLLERVAWPKFSAPPMATQSPTTGDEPASV